MSRKRKGSAFNPDTHGLILAAIARKAAAGNISAAKLFLDEYRASGAAATDGWNDKLISIAELINHPAPDRDINDLTKEDS